MYNFYEKNVSFKLLTYSLVVLFWVCFLTIQIVSFERKDVVSEKLFSYKNYISNGTYSMTNIRRPILTKTVYALTLFDDYLLNNVSICPSNKQISLLFWVHTAVAHFDIRRNIRSTFALRSRYLPEEVRVVFFVGISSNKNHMERLVKEQNRHGDIVQGNFVDSYHNLTHKAVMALRWIYEYCSSVKHVIKMDDDLVFDTRMFFEKMATTAVLQNKTLWCTVCRPNYSMIFRAGKWKVVKDEFKGYFHWPWPYCAGFVVLISNDLLTSMYRAAIISPFFWVDDVYTFGVLPSYIHGVKYRYFPSTSGLEVTYWRGEMCFRKNPSCNLIAVGAKTNIQFNTIWNFIQARYKKNDKINPHFSIV